MKNTNDAKQELLNAIGSNKPRQSVGGIAINLGNRGGGSSGPTTYTKSVVNNETNHELTITNVEDGVQKTPYKINYGGGGEAPIQAITDYDGNQLIPDQNKVVKLPNFVLPSELAAVATSGSYNDLHDKPTIPQTLKIVVGTYDENEISESYLTYFTQGLNNGPFFKVGIEIKQLIKSGDHYDGEITDVTVVNDSLTFTRYNQADLTYKPNIIDPITTNYNFSNKQFYLSQGGTDVKKFVLSYALVPELVELGYEYSYADIFSFDTSINTFKCNSSLYRPVTSGWSLAILAQQWNKQINDAPYTSSQYPTVGQLNTGAWGTLPITDVVVLNGTYSSFFREWTQGDTGTPIWVRFNADNSVNEISFTELTPRTNYDVSLIFKDTGNKQNRVLTQRDLLKDYHANCVKITANENSTIELVNSGGNNPDLQYSLDGRTWNSYSSVISIKRGEGVLLKGNNPEGFNSNSKYSNIVIDGDASISGNVMGLLDDGTGTMTTIPNDYCFYELFASSWGITSISKNFLPATTVTQSCYESMFSDCRNLRNAPNLPATTLVESCYGYMFTDCISLTQAPNLPAETLGNNCYYGMFSGCEALVTAPTLPATTLTEGCYCQMFIGCKSLFSIKIAYTGYFSNASARDAFYDWLRDTPSYGIIYYNGSDTSTGASAIPTGWQKITF